MFAATCTWRRGLLPSSFSHYKTVTHSILGTEFPHLSVCISSKHLILINLLLAYQKKKKSDAHSTHRSLHHNPSWLRDVYTHMGGSLDIPNSDSEPGKSKWLAKGNQEEMPHVSDGAILSESARVSIHIHCTLFPPNKHLTVSLSKINK